MRNVIFIPKAKNNHTVGELAEKNKFFDAAINRYYYSLYQKIIFLISVDNNSNTNAYDDRDSHKTTIQEFIEKYRHELSSEQNMYLGYLDALRRERNKADYSNTGIADENEFNKKFKCKYFQSNKVSENIISKKEREVKKNE